MFDSELPLLLLTIKTEEDQSFHVRTHIYRTQTLNGKYIIHIEEYINHVFVLKFYPLKYKRHPKKYHIVTNDNMMQQVVGTSLKLLVSFLKQAQSASFGFIATQSIIGSFIEGKSNNQRFRIYRQIMYNFFGSNTFLHFSDSNNSAYFMANKSIDAIENFMKEMQTKFEEMYPDLFNLQFKEL